MFFFKKQNMRSTVKNCYSNFLSSDLFPVDWIVIIIVTAEKQKNNKSSLYNLKAHLHTESINFPQSWSNLWKKGERKEKKNLWS